MEDGRLAVNPAGPGGQALEVVGRSVPPVDGAEKVTGRAEFAVDVAMRGMLYGKILRSPLPHARVLHVDVSRALRLPGVRAVVTGEDTPRAYFGGANADQQVLAFEKVRYVGDEVAAVAADDDEVALEALGLIRVDYEPLPAVFDPEEAMQPGAPQIHPVERNLAHEVHVRHGDVERAFDRCAAAVVEETFTTQRVHQGYLEPQACLAVPGPAAEVEIWCATQTPGRMRYWLAQALQLPIGSLRIHQTFVGGGFGGKSYQQVIPITVLLARKAGRPVKIVYSREEDFACTLPRLPMRIWIRLGADASGRLLAKETRIVADNGAYSINAPAVLESAAIRPDNLYRIEAVKTDAYLVYTNTEPTGMCRGFGNPQGTFALESAVDMLADKLRMDPVALRLLNATREGDTTIHGWRVKSCQLSACIGKVATELGMARPEDRAAPAGERATRPGEGAAQPGKVVPSGEGVVRRGVGMACVVHVNGNRSVFRPFEGSNARVRLDEDGVARVMSSCGDIGQGASTVYAQIVAEVLSLPLSAVRVERTDTQVAGFGLGAFASRVTVMAGNAVKKAAEQVREELLRFASSRLGLPVRLLTLERGRVCCRTPEGQREVPVGELAREWVYAHGGSPLAGQAFFSPEDVVLADRHSKYGHVSPTYSFGVQGIEVEVDAMTGRVRCLRAVAAYDGGRIINPLLARGQVEGGILQGLGFGLTELQVLTDGKVANLGFADYKVLTAQDAPVRMSVFFVDGRDPVGPFEAKGVGEPAVVPTLAAMANAIYHATGVRLTEPPFTPEKVLAALRGEGEPVRRVRDGS